MVKFIYLFYLTNGGIDTETDRSWGLRTESRVSLLKWPIWTGWNQEQELNPPIWMTVTWVLELLAWQVSLEYLGLSLVLLLIPLVYWCTPRELAYDGIYARVRRINVIKMYLKPKVSYSLNLILIRKSMTLHLFLHNKKKS